MQRVQFARPAINLLQSGFIRCRRCRGCGHAGAAFLLLPVGTRSS
jgi:hypothetical protein